MKKLIATTLSALLLLSGFVGCTQNNKDKVTLAYVNWAEGIAMTNLAAVILEDNFDVEVEMRLADVGLIFAALSTGDADVFMDAWMPVTHKSYLDEHSDSLDKLATSYTNASIGLVVPEYVYDAGVTKIEDLNDYATQFDGKIVGIDAGAGIMEAAARAITEYGLEAFTLQTSSEAGMMSVLKTAIEEEKFAVITGWLPHWKFDVYDLKFLEDSKKTFGEAEEIHIYSRLGFRDDRPEIAAFFSKISFTDETLGSLITAVREASTEREGAKKWAQDNREIIQGWLS